MKNSLKLFLAAAAFVGFAANANAQATDGATATAYARVIAPIQVSNVEGGLLSFGSMVASSGTVTVAPNGGVTSSGVTLVGQGTAASAAQFTVTGEPSFYYSITLPALNTVKLDGPGVQLGASNFTTENSLTASQLDINGNDAFSVGATLYMNDGQTPGTYTGSFSVTVTYN
jgi:hypothetical protein